jgi:hypothetical protein
MYKSAFLSVLLAGLLTACGGGGDDAFGGNTPGTPGGGGNNPTIAAVTVTTSTPTILSDGSNSATITALVRDATNNLIAGVPVTFTANSGGVAVTRGTTDASGSATATLTTAGDPTLRTITVTATAGGMNATVNVQVVAGGGNTTVQMGSGTGGAFQPGIIGISNANLSAGGSTSLQVVLQQSDGTLYAQNATITFNSPCAAQNLASITSPVQTSTGIASATYSATGCSGSDVITATATIGGNALSASGTVTVAQAAIGSIVFESATPTNIALRGTGGAGRPEASTVVFRVLDQSGGPRAGADVQFALNSSVGGLALSPASGQSDANGRVQTVVQSGTAAASVRVTATVTSVTPQISTQSAALTVTTGIPDQDSFSLSVLCPNVEAWSRDGVQVPVTARLADRYNNPVPDGTAVTLNTEGGQIQSQCLTQSNSTQSGFCTVNWTSANPRATTVIPGPGGDLRAGRSTVFASAIGEESFTDANGNGAFDVSETFVDLPERFRDENENGAYESGELIYDFNNNSTRDPVDTVFNGVLCNDPARCNANAVSTGISASNLIIMSDGSPTNVAPLAGTPLNIAALPGAASMAVMFADLNDNPLPQGTKITASVSGTGLAVATPNSFTVPCTTEPTQYGFTVTASATAVDGVLTILVEAPSGLQTILQYPVNVP